MKDLFKNKPIKAISLLAIIIAGGGWVFFNALSNESDNTQPVSEKETITVRTEKILPETVKQCISVSAVTEPFEKVEVFPEMNGKVFAFYCSEGDYVNKGQILAKLETDRSLLTNFENAKTNLKIAKESQENTEKLQKQLKKDAKGTPSEKSARKSARLAVDAAEGQVKVARGQVNYIQSQLDKYLIKAPASGFISRINLDKGDLAVMTTPIAVISNSQKIKIEAALTEFDIGKISVGQEAEINLAAYPGEKFTGEVYHVGSVADPISKKFPVKIQLANKDGKIKAGMIAGIKIITAKQENILTVPKAAVFIENGVEKIYVVGNDSRIKIVAVKTETLGGKLKVTEGLVENDEVVINGNYELDNGEKVTVKK
ncbi:efflux RND transporter periplasmic adaptor subunit [bacterium]|nr:efflux RND transporter periplasmic adaptor subunit [bacterium]